MCREACGKYVLTIDIEHCTNVGCFFHFTAPSPSYDEALKLYSKALDKHPNTAVLWKRKVAVHKARGDMEEAVKELCQFLEV